MVCEYEGTAAPIKVWHSHVTVGKVGWLLDYSHQHHWKGTSLGLISYLGHSGYSGSIVDAEVLDNSGFIL